MPDPRRVSAAAARRFLATRHLLVPPRSLPPTADSVMAVVERLGSLQFDPLEVAGRNHDLVLAARIDGYRRELTDELLYGRRALYEAYNKGLSLLPTSELPWHRLGWDRMQARHAGGAFDEHAPLVEELLARIRADGPLSPTDVAPRAAIDWYWRPTNQVRAILEALAEAGILGIARREGNRRVYDLAERLFPPDLLARRVPKRAQQLHKLLSRYRGHGLLGAGGQAELWYAIGVQAIERGELRRELVDAGELVPVTVEGVRGERYVVAADLPLLESAEREIGSPLDGSAGAAFLAPLDPLVWDRDLLRRLYGFDYVWEVYVPAEKRRWGYYVLPIHFGDRLVGRIEPRIERRSDRLAVVGLWWEDGFDPLAEPGFVPAFAGALDAHRRFGGVTRIALPRTRRHRELVAALRPLLAPRNGARRGPSSSARQTRTPTVLDQLPVPATFEARTRKK